MDLLQTFRCAYLDAIYERTAKKGIGFCFALSVNGLITIGEPFDKSLCLRSGKGFSQSNDAFIVEHVRFVFFTICCI